jgi:peptidoglycan hydrolase-like protein with peptidoglycan-binding domain
VYNYKVKKIGGNMKKKLKAFGLVAMCLMVTSVTFAAIQPPAKASAAGCVDTVLRQGSSQYGFTGNCVALLQQMLNGEGAFWRYSGYSSLSVDRQFGPLTRSQVIAFQKFGSLQVDGVVGRQTWTRLCVNAKAMNQVGHGGSAHQAGWYAGCSSIVEWY